jgi:hypothetical protein
MALDGRAAPRRDESEGGGSEDGFDGTTACVHYRTYLICHVKNSSQIVEKQ